MSKYRKFFPFPSDDNTIYFDNAATNMKLSSVIKGEEEFLTKINANPHSRDFERAFVATDAVEHTRKLVSEFINSEFPEEIIFTAGTTFSLNQVVFGWRTHFKKGANVVINTLEHASNILPWMALEKEGILEVRYAELNENGTLNIDKLSEVIDENTEFVSFAAVTNTYGSSNDVKAVTKKVRSLNPKTMVVVDAAQAIAHIKTDVRDWDVDFIAFSTHKMFGPFGLGVLYGRKKYLEILNPLLYGGGNNYSITKEDFVLSDIPDKFEAGTPNASAIFALKYVFEFFKNEISVEEIQKREAELKNYAIKKIGEMKNKSVTFYNLDNESPMLLFNVEGIPSQDLGTYISSEYKIAIRTGTFCAKLLPEFNGCRTAARASLCFINTEEEIDKLLEALDKSSENWLNAIV